MQISSHFVGADSKELETEVTWRQSMNFAAGIGDNNPLYFDDEREEGIIAPPMLAVALTWPIPEHADEYWQSDEFPFEVLWQQVHYTETIVWHRVMAPGDRLKIKGTIAAIVPRRGGTLMAIKFEARDAKDQAVFTEYAGAMLRAVRCPDGGAGEENLPDYPTANGEPEPLWVEPLHIDPLASHVFDGCADVHFPIHASKRFARMVRLPGIILQGTATLSMAVRELTNREASGNPSRLGSVSCRFTGMVLPGTDIAVRLLGKSPQEGKTDVFFEVLNHEGRRAISYGHATILDEDAALPIGLG